MKKNNKFVNFYTSNNNRVAYSKLEIVKTDEKLPLYYKSMKYTVRPLFFAVGWLVKKKILSKTEV